MSRLFTLRFWSKIMTRDTYFLFKKSHNCVLILSNIYYSSKQVQDIDNTNTPGFQEVKKSTRLSTGAGTSFYVNYV